MPQPPPLCIPPTPSPPTPPPPQGWVKQISSFIRQRAPHHLIASGLDGTFGPSTPHHRQRNARLLPPGSPLEPPALVSRHDASCTGEHGFDVEFQTILGLPVCTFFPDIFMIEFLWHSFVGTFGPPPRATHRPAAGPLLWSRKILVLPTSAQVGASCGKCTPSHPPPFELTALGP